MTLQEQINAAPIGSTLNAPGEFVENIIINKPLTLIGAKIVSPNADPAVTIPPKTRDVTLRSCEITGSGPKIHAIVEIGLSQTTVLADVPTNIWIDQCDIHGHATQNVQRGVAANGANIKITNCKIWEIHGLGYDTQAICCWNGPGPFLIEGNYLEAAGENVMFGGSPAAIQGLIPTDIIVRRNHCRKPLSWYVGDPSYAGIKWSVKNLFELKNARRVLVEGNIFDGNWTDAQTGRAIQFTPRPSDSGHWAAIEDVEFINNIIRNTGAGLNVLGADEPPAPTETRLRRVRIANNIWEIDGRKFGSDGVFLVITNRTEDVTVENNTVFHNGNIISTDYAPNSRFIYRNNISRHNTYGIFGSGASTGNATIAQYFPDGDVAGNVMAKEGEAPGNVEAVYPVGNHFPATMAEVGFVDLNGRNLRLADSSPFKGKGTNGKDPGCDIEALNAALEGAPTPLPTPTPEPLPTPTDPTPAPIPSPDGTKGTRIVDSQLAVWTIGPNKETLRDGKRADNGQGDIYKYLNKEVYTWGDIGQEDPTKRNWYKWIGSWVSVGTVEPGVTPQPDPIPIPDPVPEPSPTPVPPPATPRTVRWPTSFSEVMALISAQGRESYRPTGRQLPRPSGQPKGNYVEFVKF